MPDVISERIPSLDGMRFLSALLVVVCHGIGTPYFPLDVAQAYPTAHLGHLAVQTFFVLSGFLITHLLMEEQRTTGGLKLGRFYLRRSFRIFPVAYAYVGVALLLALAGLVEMTPGGTLAALGYTINHYPARPPVVSHFWTLGVEEQFYLLWPAVLLWAGPRRAGHLLLAVVFICPWIRLLLWRYGDPDWRWNYWFVTQADALAIGCLLACYRPALWANRWYQRIVQSPWIGGLAWPLATLLTLLHDRPRLYNFLLVTLILCLIAIFLDHATRYPNAGLARVLNHPWIAGAGLWSYSLYVWQQLFMNRDTGWIVTWFPLNAALSLAAGYLSYRLIERPLHPFGRRQSSQLGMGPPPLELRYQNRTT